MQQTPLTEIDLAVLARLYASPDGKLLEAILVQRLQAADEGCRMLDGPALHRAQGTAQAIERLLTDLRSARDMIDALRPSHGIGRNGRDWTAA